MSLPRITVCSADTNPISEGMGPLSLFPAVGNTKALVCIVFHLHGYDNTQTYINPSFPFAMPFQFQWEYSLIIHSHLK